MDRRHIQLEGGPYNGRMLDPTDKEAFGIVMPGMVVKPVARYATTERTHGAKRIFVFTGWAPLKTKRKKRRTKHAA